MIKYLFRYHFEWMTLLAGLVLMALMNPYIDNGHSWCLFEMAGLTFCPGEGLGHAIAFTARGDLSNALQAHPLGPAAVLILGSRICYLWKRAFNNRNLKEKETSYG